MSRQRWQSAVKHVEADYEVPFLAHATMEPQTCTAHVANGGVEVWVPTQEPMTALATAASAAGVPNEKVVVHGTFLGGGFGRRAAIQEFVRQAVLIAKEVDVPVKLLWSREEDIKHDYYRPFGMARLVAGLGADGMPIAWKVRIAGPSFVHGLVPGFGMSFVDRTFISGLADEMAYDVPNYLVDYVVEQSPVPLGVWRAINYTQNTFYKESFVDEMAHAAAMDPYLYRRHLLRSNQTHLAVLDAAAKKADWFSPLPEDVPRHRRDASVRQRLRASGGSLRRARRSARASRRLGARLRQCGQSAVDRDADRRRRHLRADRGAERRDHHQERRRRAVELRHL